MLWLLESLLIALLGLGGVAFITLLERKILGLSQVRLGPNKITLMGLLQPVADGVKLLFKELYISLMSYKLLFVVSPAILLTLFLIIWMVVIPWPGNITVNNTSSLLFFSLLGMSAYAVILSGWNIMSSFSKLGGLRGVLQSLSYEVALILVFMYILTMYSSYNIMGSVYINWESSVIWLIVWYILSMMETNRAPFDLLEGESELISGFNIEMGSLLFVLLFLSEYGMIIVMSLVAGMLLNSMAIVLVVSSMILLARSCYPRMRYDSLMSFMWQSVLPLGLLLFFLVELAWS